MPNWVEGKLKVRGKPEDIKRWVEECLHCYTTNWLGDGAHTELVKGAVRFEHDPDSEEMYLYVDKSAHIEGTRRNFIEKGEYLFMRFWWADVPRICIENPIPSRVFCLPQYTQTIQPYEYGHPYSKKTCLWLKNLPPLFPTDIVTPVATWCPSGSYSKKHGQQHKGVFTTDRAKNRAKTFTGVANAMSEQWG